MGGEGLGGWMSQVSRHNQSDGKLPSLGIIQCLRMEVSRQNQSDGKLPSLEIVQCLRMEVSRQNQSDGKPR